MKRLAPLFLLCFLWAPGPGQCDELTAEKKAAIRELLQVTGALEMGELFGSAFSQQMIQVLRQSKPDIDPKAFDIVKEEADILIHEELVVKESLHPFMFPVYHKFLTLEETRGLIEFYKTPLGQKAVAVMPQMTQEGMRAGQQWGQSIAHKLERRIAERFEKEGLRLQ